MASLPFWPGSPKVVERTRQGGSSADQQARGKWEAKNIGLGANVKESQNL